MFHSVKLPRLLSSACLAIAAGFALCIPASAAVSMDTVLTGYGDAGDVNVHAVVTKYTSGSSYYLYSYTLSYASGVALHTFGLANDMGTAFFDASSTLASTGTGVLPGSGLFVSPQYDALTPYADVQWVGDANAEIKAGQSRTFTYKSLYAPQDLSIYCFAADGGGGAEGETLGMGYAVPEPGSMLALMLGISGCAPFLIKRRMA